MIPFFFFFTNKITVPIFFRLFAISQFTPSQTINKCDRGFMSLKLTRNCRDPTVGSLKARVLSVDISQPKS